MRLQNTMQKSLCADVDKSPFTGSKPYLFTAAAILLSYLFFNFIWKADKSVIQIGMLAGVAVCLFFAFKNRPKIELVILAVIIAGIILRTGYILYTPYDLRTHDLGNPGDNGQFDYMYNLLLHGTLPATNQGQFYHPPLQQSLQVLVIKFFQIFQPHVDTYFRLMDPSKLVPCFASCAILWISYKICQEAKLPVRATLIAVSVIAFHPTFFILSGFVNNDAFMLLFFMVAVLYTIRWYYKPTMKNILIVALGLGLSVMSKLSGSIVALFIAPVFIAVLIQKIREKTFKGLIAQFAAFLSISLPLALWFPIRQYILFGQPLNFVLPMVGHNGYTGDYPFFQRFLTFPQEQILNPTYCRPFTDYNLWVYTLKCSIFGEFSFNSPAFLAQMLVISNLAMILFSLAAMVYVMLRCKQVNKFIRFGLFWIWLVQIISFVYFNIGYPYGCTMDFRYIMPTAIVGAIYFGVALHALKDKNKPAHKAFYYAGIACFVFFAVASTLFYTLPVL
jgi:4-amino-4-deoxy-L-arabinose transferase-like glycosyltransferase